MPVDLMELNQGASPDQGFDAPGSTDSRAVDINSNDPLVHLGLVDPGTGHALPTDEWRPAETQAQAQQPAPQTQQSAPASQPAPVGGMSPEAGTQFLQTQAVLQSQAAQAYATAISQGADPRQAEAIIGAKLEAEISKARSSANWWNN